MSHFFLTSVLVTMKFMDILKLMAAFITMECHLLLYRLRRYIKVAFVECSFIRY